jgi:hypothetical protein
MRQATMECSAAHPLSNSDDPTATKQSSHISVMSFIAIVGMVAVVIMQQRYKFRLNPDDQVLMDDEAYM